MTNSIQEHFADLPDPRRAQGKRHRLSDMIVIAVCAVICCADSWADVADFGNAKLKWFETFLDLPHGIPCQDTFERVFARLDPDAFEQCFMSWTAALAGSSSGGGKRVAIDGKRIRRSFAHAWDHSTATHLVSAFAHENATVLGQLAVDCKENEIVAIPKLLELLDLSGGATVTVDAMGCQTEIAAKIVENGGDYVLAVKENQPALHDALVRNLDEMILEKFAGMRHGFVQSVDGDHGRIETRRAWVTDQLDDWLDESQRSRWAGLRSVAVVEALREVPPKPVAEVERRYFISSLGGTDAARMAECVRGHWSVENKLHWVLDVSFAEDQARHRKDHSAENFSRLRRIALNLLRRETGKKRGIKGKRLNAAWDHDYLLKLLGG
jgi:predicted transposase YbfD/YdcC